MDPITFAGVVASIITIVEFLERRGQRASPRQIAEAYGHGDIPGLSERRPKISYDDAASTAGQYLALRELDAAFVARIKSRCMKPLQEAIDDHHLNETDVDEASEIARHCVCSNIGIARRTNGGRFPNDQLKQWYEQFRCASL